MHAGSVNGNDVTTAGGQPDNPFMDLLGAGGSGSGTAALGAEPLAEDDWEFDVVRDLE